MRVGDDDRRMCTLHAERVLCFWHRPTRSVMCSRCLLQRGATGGAGSAPLINIDDVAAIESVAVDEAHQFLVMFPARLEDLCRALGMFVCLSSILGGESRIPLEALVATETSLVDLVVAFANATRTTPHPAAPSAPSAAVQSSKCARHPSRSIEWWREHDNALLCSRCLIEASATASQEGLVAPIHDAVDAMFHRVKALTSAARSVLQLQGATLGAVVCAARMRCPHAMLEAAANLLQRATAVLDAVAKTITISPQPTSMHAAASSSGMGCMGDSGCSSGMGDAVRTSSSVGVGLPEDDQLIDNIAVRVIEQLLDDDEAEHKNVALRAPTAIDGGSATDAVSMAIRRLGYHHPEMVAGQAAGVGAR